MSKKKFETYCEFVELVEGRMEVLGFQKDTTSRNAQIYALYYNIPTIFGNLVIAIRKYTLEKDDMDMWSKNLPIFVHTRFENASEASQMVNCNKYTGKWNFYLYILKEFESEVERFFGELSQVLLPKAKATLEKLSDVEVIFRKFKDGRIIALLPYEFVGVAGGCRGFGLSEGRLRDYHDESCGEGITYGILITNTVPASGDEIAPMLEALRNDAYNVKIIKRRKKKKYEALLEVHRNIEMNAFLKLWE